MKDPHEQMECEQCGWEGERQDTLQSNHQHTIVWSCPKCGKPIEVEPVEVTVKWRSAI